MGGEELPRQATQAIATLVRCVRNGLTGSLVVHFKDGIPMKAETTSSERFGPRGVDRSVMKQ